MRCTSGSCAAAPSPPSECDCSCNGAGHGKGVGWIPLPLFALSASFSVTEETARLASREAIDVLNRDHVALTTDLADAVGHAVEDAVSAGQWGRAWLRRQRKKRRGHWLCYFLEDVANALAKLAPVTLTTEIVKRACRRAKMGRFATVAATAAAEKVTQILTTTVLFASQVDQAIFLLRVAAVAVCPDLDDHPSLERTWASKLAGKLADDEAKIYLSQPT